MVWYCERVESLTSYREEEDTCTDTCTIPNFRYKETREDKSLQLKKVFNELAEELKVCSYFLSSNSHLNIMLLIVCSLFGTFRQTSGINLLTYILCPLFTRDCT